MRRAVIIILPVLILLIWLNMAPAPLSTPMQSEKFDTVAHEYTSKYDGLSIPSLSTSWKTNMAAELKHAPRLEEQKSFFLDMKTRLGEIQRENLTTCQRINLKILIYETRLNLDRIPIALKYTHSKPNTQTDLGYSSFPHGKKWYDWYLLKWLTTDMTPSDIMAFGDSEVNKALADLAKLEGDIISSEVATSLGEFIETKSTHYANEVAILAAFESRKNIIAENLDKLFMPYDIASIGIRPNTNPAMDRAPGYYVPPDFYYGWNGTSYRAQDTDFLYLHEGVPGHHFQIQIAEKYKTCIFVMPQIFYSAFVEGWAAYVETLGTDLGVYDSFETRLGAIDWNLIRSTRVYLDIAINHHGWSDKQAHAYWQKKLPPHLHGLAAREIKRMRDWPAQVITYKIGANAILRLKASEQKRLGAKFDIRKFHDTLLRMGPVPLSILESSYAELYTE